MKSQKTAKPRQDWQTPEYIVEAVHKVFPGGFLDPCTSPDNPTRAAYWYANQCMNGLEESWKALKYTSPPMPYVEGVYVNPPWNDIPPWVDKILAEKIPTILLVPARTYNDWGQYVLRWSNCVCFVDHRVKFRGAKAGYPFPVMVALFNTNVYHDKYYPFCDTFCDLGTIVGTI